MSKNWLDSTWDWFVGSNKKAYSSISMMDACMSNYMLQKRAERAIEKLEQFSDPKAQGCSGICAGAREYSMRFGEGIRYVSQVTLWGAFLMLLRMLAIMITVFVWIPFLIFLLHSS